MSSLDRATSPTESPSEARVILIGMTGVQWSDVSAASTPALAALATRGAIASNVVRSLRPAACPADGWLALSSGTRAADAPSDSCRAIAEPTGASASEHTDGVVPRWDEYLVAAGTGGFDAAPGRLGSTLDDSGITAHAFGPGAAIALAKTNGTVARYSPVISDADAVSVAGNSVRDEFSRAVTAALGSTQVLIFDAGTVVDTSPTPRADQVAVIDARVRTILSGVASAAVPEGVTTLVASVADDGADPHLGIAIAAGPAPHARTSAETPAPTESVRFAPVTLTSSSTRQPGYVLTHDVLATLIAAADNPELRDAFSAGTIGAPMVETGLPGALETRVSALLDDARKGAAVQGLVAPFYLVLALLVAALLIVASRALARIGLSTARPQPRRVLGVARACALWIAALPLASYLINLVPWWRAGIPALAAAGLLITAAAALTAVSLIPPWRHLILGPAGLIAGLTAAVLALDVAFGARLQLASLMGTQPLVAGRFYGLNNSAFALFATAAIVLAVAVATPLMQRGRRLAAASAIALVGLVAVAIDGLPSIGADFGGPPALVPAFAYLVIAAAGVRLTWRTILGVGAGGLAVVIGFAALDWMRPEAARTHLGAAFQTALDGGLIPVVGRKLSQNLANIAGTWITPIAMVVAIGLIVWLGRPLVRAARQPNGGPYAWLVPASGLERPLSATIALLRPALIALAIAHAIAFALNDSGITMPGIGALLAAPLLAAIVASWLSSTHDSAHTSAASHPAPAH